MKRNVTSLIVTFVFVFGMSSVGLSDTWYVDGDKVESGDGTSWAEAVKTIPEAISKASKYDQIWVKEGIYSLSSPIELNKDVSVKGGFSGTETTIWERDWQSNITTVDGGGAVYHCFEVSSGRIDGFIVTGGNANGSAYPDNVGGGVYIWGGAPSIANCTFSGNRAERGGAIYTYYHYSTSIFNCSFSGNTATYGGAIYNAESEPIIRFCNFSGNSAEIQGGAVFNSNESGPTIRWCTFSDNNAQSGGGIYNGWLFESTIDDCVFSGNRAENGGGGAIFNELSWYSELVITDCIFSNNEAVVSDGGGIHNYDSSPTITNCSFIENIAESGGGIYNTWYSSPIIGNCTFYRNEVLYPFGGGGVFMDFYSDPTLINCTFSGNSAGYGGGMFISSSNPTVFNSIFWGNTADEGSQISLHNSANPSISYCDLQGGQAGVYVETGSTVDWGAGIISDNPLFVDEISGNLHLQLGSPAIDTGTDPIHGDYEAETDKDGFPRMIDGDLDFVRECDMGAYERQHDADNDGILDIIDTVPDTFSNDFSDIDLPPFGITHGTIIDRGDQTLMVGERPNPHGIRIKAVFSVGDTPAIVSVCGGELPPISVTGFDESNADCESLIIEVLMGPIEILFSASQVLEVHNGVTVKVTELLEGLFHIENYGDSTGTCVLKDQGEVILLIEPGEHYDVELDSDGDGVPDVNDDCPTSDLSSNVIIDGCDTGVRNNLLENGCNISDQIAQCADGAKNHGKFVSCVAHLTNNLEKEGIITGKEEGKIQRCAAKADIP